MQPQQQVGNKKSNNLDEISSENRISALNGGCKDAFKEIFVMYHSKVSHFFHTAIHSSANVQELVVELFEKVWRNRKEIDINTDLNLYIYSIARKMVIDHARAEQTQRVR